MTANPALANDPARQRRHRLSWVMVTALAILGLLTLIAVTAPLFAQRGADVVTLHDSLKPAVWGGGTWSSPLGTDQLGRDVLQQLSGALRISAVVAAVSVLLAGLLGVCLGLVSGYTGGWVDFVVGRITEAQLGLPILVVAITLAIALGPSLSTIIVAIALTSWVPFARLVRAETLVLREREFVLLAKIADVSYPKVLRRHLLPNILPSVVTLATQQVAIAIIEAASLSYLGLGVQPPVEDLGSMISQSQILLTTNPSLPLVPIVTLALLSLAVNLAGDHLHERMDVRR